MKLHMKFENSKNTFSPENPQIVAYVNINQIVITKVMWIKDHQKKFFSSNLPSYLSVLNLFNVEIV